MNGVTVLGRHPSYLHLSDSLGARHFEVSPTMWATMDAGSRWNENRFFLNRTVFRRERIVLSTPPARAPIGSSYWMELRYLRVRYGKSFSRLETAHVVL